LGSLLFTIPEDFQILISKPYCNSTKTRTGTCLYPLFISFQALWFSLHFQLRNPLSYCNILLYCIPTTNTSLVHVTIAPFFLPLNHTGSSHLADSARTSLLSCVSSQRTNLQLILSLLALDNALSAYFTIAYCLTFILEKDYPVLVYDTVDPSYADYIFLNIFQTTAPQTCYFYLHCSHK